MYEQELNKISKEKLIDLCDSLLIEMWHNGTFSNHYILSLIKELEEN